MVSLWHSSTHWEGDQRDWNYHWIDPGEGAKEDLTDIGGDFLAVVPALRIMQLSVEGLSAAKRKVSCSIEERQKIDVIYLEETHVDSDKAYGGTQLPLYI